MMHPADFVSVENAGVPGRLAPLTFTVPAGTASALTGPNGSGKTTALRLVAGLEAPAGGRIQVAGAAPDRRSAAFRGLVATFFDTTPLDPALTFSEHAGVLAASWASQDPGVRARYGDYAAALGVAHLAERFPHEMSSGERQLMRLSLVLARPARLLLLDEPEGRLAKGVIGVLAGLLRERLDTGDTVLVSTHRPDLVTGLGAAEVKVGEA
ncbi:ATP-binding cassette domain-containing protein [Brevibacterium sp. 50QC2O2]|uniref:ABC transporter ATP-binding protein n=1 Tax=Brevibacterium TaxID=1696 RepID=UPI00211B8433|nr:MULTISPECIES: ATP-binding cassette domain-containing protein [unclassified Brevibacterium]MCQ9367708.1 ATP-binding cassette domain-containing protein [Brevibacterium sp. 91QC2O2]MCQ9384986.1 ATP-binding cassette domain-containing protein [Brevibacterium sp. 68QC2CO]MCQ9387967.1 ATP-binding cassette domain-containing protein [Brevibacterium sp. 50QC2O2]